MRKLPLLLLPLSLSPACSNDDSGPVALVTVTGLQSQHRSLRVAAQVGGALAMTEEFQGPPERFGLRFAPEASTGTLQLAAEVYTTPQCVAARGRAEAPLPAAPGPGARLNLTLPLTTLASQLCTCTNTAPTFCLEVAPAQKRLESLWVSGPGGLYLVGEAGTVLYGSDTGFTARTEGVPPTVDLRHVWGTRASGKDQVFAVGSRGTALRYDPSTQRWTALNTGMIGEDLYAVWGADVGELWLAGAGGVLLRGDGGAAAPSFVPVTAAPITTSAIRGLWGAGRADVWAVGDGGLLLRWDGESWSRFPSPTTNALRGVWGSGRDDIWAVGAAGTLLHFDGQRWSKQDGPAGVLSDLNAVWGSGKDDVWAVGDGTVALQRTASGWRAVVSQLALGVSVHLRAVGGAGPNFLWMAGASSTIVRKRL